MKPLQSLESPETLHSIHNGFGPGFELMGKGRYIFYGSTD